MGGGATGLKGKCFLNEIKAALPRSAGALKTGPKATEIKVTFVQRGGEGGWLEPPETPQYEE